jgi:glycosyltransferase involved in cell wall biosynthesis
MFLGVLYINFKKILRFVVSYLTFTRGELIMKLEKDILILAADFHPNNTGFANATKSLINSLKTNQPDINIHVFTTVNLGKNKEIEDVKVLRYNEKFNKGKVGLIISEYKKFLYLKEYIEENNIDFIFLETNTFTILQTFLVKKYKDILGVRIHSTADTEVLMYAKRNNIISKVLKWLTLKFMKEIKYIISTNKYHLDFIKEVMFDNNVYTIWSGKEYFILPNTVNINNDQLKKEIKSKEGNYLLSMGKLSNSGYIQKGLKDLIKSIYILKENNDLPENFFLKIIGDGEKREELIDYSKDLDVYKYVEFIRKTPHNKTLELIKNSKAIILLSRYEGQSMFITESLAIGKPLIITQNNGMKDMIVKDKNGLVVEEGNYLNASGAIRKIYNLSSDKLNNMEKKSREIFESKFSSQVISEKFKQILNMIKPT